MYIPPADSASPKTAAQRKNGRSLPNRFADRGYRTILVSDESQLIAIGEASDFDEIVQLKTDEAAEDSLRADEISQTHIARLFAAVSDTIRESVEIERDATGACCVAAKTGVGPLARHLWTMGRAA